MVMHARKLPRLDDGYTDKRESHPYQPSQYPSKPYSYAGDRYDRQRSPGRADSSPSRCSPRYSNKASYTDRAKEKYERGTTGSPGKKVNHVYPGSSSNHSNNGHPGNSQDRMAASTSRTNSNTKDNKAEVQKSAIRSCGDWAEHLSSTGKKYYYNCKSEVSQWEKPREWNDGSTNRHSAESKCGDKYKETKNRHSSGPQSLEKREKHLGDLRHMVADGNPKPDKLYLFEKLQESQSKLQAEIQANMAANRPLYALDHPTETYPDDRRDTLNSDGYTRRSRRDSDGPRGITRQGSRQDHSDELDVSPDSTPTSSRSANCTSQLPTASIPSSYNPAILSAMTAGSTPNLNISSIPGLLTQLSGGQNNQALTNQALVTLQKLQQALSWQIAAQQSSVATQQNTASHHAHHSASSVLTSPRIPQPHTHHAQQEDVSPYMHHSHLLSPGVPLHPHPATIQTLPHSQSYNPNVHKSPYSSQNSLPHSQLSPQPHSVTVSMATHSTGIPIVTSSPTIPITQTSGGNQLYPHLKANTVYGKFLGSHNRTPPAFPHMLEDTRSSGGGVDGTEYGAEINRSMCCSPTPSETSSQGAGVDPEMFTAATNGQHEEKKDTMTNLRQYYNENLVGHVTGWQAEHVERQSRAVWEESLKIGSLLCSQVSVELKRSRSLVRVEEIQATLNEQRNLFLAQQVHELESIKPVSSYMSSS